MNLAYFHHNLPNYSFFFHSKSSHHKLIFKHFSLFYNLYPQVTGSFLFEKVVLVVKLPFYMIQCYYNDLTLLLHLNDYKKE